MATDDHDKDGRDDLLIAALASGRSYQEAAEIGQCSKSTVARRMGAPSFRAEVSLAREEYVDMMRGHLLEALPAAVVVLADLMMSAKSDADRIRAARALLEVQRRDPMLDENGVRQLLRRIVDVAMAHVPEESQASFIAQVRAIT